FGCFRCLERFAWARLTFSLCHPNNRRYFLFGQLAHIMNSDVTHASVRAHQLIYAARFNAEICSQLAPNVLSHFVVRFFTLAERVFGGLISKSDKPYAE